MSVRIGDVVHVGGAVGIAHVQVTGRSHGGLWIVEHKDGHRERVRGPELRPCPARTGRSSCWLDAGTVDV